MPSMEKPFPTYVETPSFATALAEMMQDHAVGRHVCVIGDRGAGKSALAGAFAVRLGYQAEIFSLYADMSARELLQSRGQWCSLVARTSFALACPCSAHPTVGFVHRYID